MEATFEEFIILLKTYPGLEITLLVQEKLTAYRDMEANHSLQRDKFYVRVSSFCCNDQSMKRDFDNIRLLMRGLNGIGKVRESKQILSALMGS